MSLGKAISGMKKMGHSMKEDCAPCEGGMCKFAFGGTSEPADKDSVQKGADIIAKGVSPSAAKGIASAFAKGGQVGDVHISEEGGDKEMDMDKGSDELLHQCAGELINALETKNKKEILESIKAIVMSIKG